MKSSREREADTGRVTHSYLELEKRVEELAETNERLQERARLRREFLRNVSHELATPMTPVVGYLKLLLNEELGPLTPIQRKSLLAIQNSTEKLRALIDTLLDVTGFETDRMHFYARNFDFAELVQRAVHDVRNRFEDCGITLTTKLARNPMPCAGDSDKLARAMWHILDNAIKFTPPGGEVAVAVDERREAGGVFYVFTVIDSGHGIEQSEIEKVTEPFYQVDGSATRSFGGVGLGLAFVKRVVDVAGGALRLESPPSQTVDGQAPRGTQVMLMVPAPIPSPTTTVQEHAG